MKYRQTFVVLRSEHSSKQNQKEAVKQTTTEGVSNCKFSINFTDRTFYTRFLLLVGKKQSPMKFGFLLHKIHTK